MDTLLFALRRLLATVGPYLAVEILLPGGTLLTLALYLYRRRKFSNRCRSGASPFD